MTISKRLGRVRNTKFGTNVFNKMLLNAAKCHGYSFYRLQGIKGKSMGGRGEVKIVCGSCNVLIAYLGMRCVILSVQKTGKTGRILIHDISISVDSNKSVQC